MIEITFRKRKHIIADDLGQWAATVVSLVTNTPLPKGLVEAEKRKIACEKKRRKRKP